MRIIDADALNRTLAFPALIEALRTLFREGCSAPTRHHHTVEAHAAGGEAHAAGGEGTLLLMPAWQAGAYMGVKIVTIFPDNTARALPTVIGQYYLMDAASGAPLALMDGTVLTRWRTAAASALAADYLARKDARRLLMVGAGSLAPFLVRAHATVRPIEAVRVWSRTPENAARVAHALARDDLAVTATDDLEAGVAWADVVSCATLAKSPLVLGDWLTDGTHLDLVGAFRADMREADDTALMRARIYVDTRGGAFGEAGDLLQAIESGAITRDAVVADLAELTREDASGPGTAREITLFKSVGASLEDLAAARLAYEASTARGA